MRENCGIFFIKILILNFLVAFQLIKCTLDSDGVYNNTESL